MFVKLLRAGTGCVDEIHFEKSDGDNPRPTGTRRWARIRIARQNSISQQDNESQGAGEARRKTR